MISFSTRFNWNIIESSLARRENQSQKFSSSVIIENSKNLKRYREVILNETEKLLSSAPEAQFSILWSEISLERE